MTERLLSMTDNVSTNFVWDLNRFFNSQLRIREMFWTFQNAARTFPEFRLSSPEWTRIHNWNVKNCVFMEEKPFQFLVQFSCLHFEKLFLRKF